MPVAEVAPEDQKIAAGAFRVWLDGLDAHELEVKDALDKAHAAKDAAEAELRASLTKALLGKDGLAFREDDVVDLKQRRQNVKARTKAVVAIDQWQRRFGAALLPPAARQPAGAVA